MAKEKYTKEETLAFIEYLRSKSDVIIDQILIPRHSFFNHWVEDTSKRAKEVFSVLMKAGNTEQAYGYLAHEKAKLNCLWKTFPQGGYMFKEDWEEYQQEHTEPLPEKVQAWAKKHTPLESRSIVFDLFPTEYQLFKQRAETEENARLTAGSLHEEDSDHGICN